MNTNGLLSEDEVLSIIKDEFGTATEQEFDLRIPNEDNGGGVC